jgi:hypothetical protein
VKNSIGDGLLQQRPDFVGISPSMFFLITHLSTARDAAKKLPPESPPPVA